MISLLEEDQLAVESGDHGRCLGEAPTMFKVAQLVGEAVQRTNETVGEALEKMHIDSSVELLLGGRIGDERLRLFLVYSAGNFIECTSEVPFVQIGFIVAFGVLLDTLIVRSILVPALTLDIGKRIWWPSALARRAPATTPAGASDRREPAIEVGD